MPRYKHLHLAQAVFDMVKTICHEYLGMYYHTCIALVFKELVDSIEDAPPEAVEQWRQRIINTLRELCCNNPSICAKLEEQQQGEQQEAPQRPAPRPRRPRERPRRPPIPPPL